MKNSIIRQEVIKKAKECRVKGGVGSKSVGMSGDNEELYV